MKQPPEQKKINSFLGAGPGLAAGVPVGRYYEKLQNFKFAVYDAAADTYRPIPAATRCLHLAEDFWYQLVIETGRVFEALNKVAVWMRQDEQAAIASRIYAALCPLEQDAAYGRLEQNTGSATIRFDLFVDGDSVKILEINTTIPAMQAYSDMVTQSYLCASGPTGAAPGTTGEGEDCGADSQMVSNTFELLESLREHYAIAGGSSDLSRIAIVARAGDSQMGELLHYQSAWKKLGYKVEIVTPELLRINGDRLVDEAGPYDLIYRHVFASRIDPSLDFATALRRSSHFKIFNPISGHLEVKALFAELSRVGDSAALATAVGLTSAEVAAVRKLVPWSRVLMPPTGDSPAGQEQVRNIAARRDRIVLKKSHGYGGHGVILGREFESEEVQKQAKALMRPAEDAVDTAGTVGAVVNFADFVSYCCQSTDDVWIAQELVPGVVLDNEVLVAGEVQAMKTFIDLSMFGNSGVAFRPRGTAARIGSHQIVNIGRGGGMMPVVFYSRTEAGN